MHLKLRPPQIKLRHKVAALGVVAVAMVAVPLVQVLRYQSTAINAALYAQAGLDPVSGAVTLHHALLAHRDIAGLVLRGTVQLEPERTVRQAEVDDRSGSLEAALFALKLPRAVSEIQALRHDWSMLVPQVEQRKIRAADSDAAHRLLVEQTLQVMDLVAEATGLDHLGPMKTYLASLHELSSLPQASATTPISAPDLVAPAAAARQAQLQKFEAASHALGAALTARVDRVRQERAQLLALLGALAALAFGLLLTTARHLVPTRPDGQRTLDEGFDSQPDGQTLHRDVSGRLWQRMRLDSNPDAPVQPTPDTLSHPPHKDNRT